MVHRPTMPMSSRYQRYNHGVMTIAFSKGLLTLSLGSVDGRGRGSGVDNAANTATTPRRAMTAAMKLLPMSSGLGATKSELECLVQGLLSSWILPENYP